MFPLVVCDGWAKVVAQKICCVQRSPQWCGMGAARVDHENEQVYEKKPRSPVNRTN